MDSFASSWLSWFGPWTRSRSRMGFKLPPGMRHYLRVTRHKRIRPRRRVGGRLRPKRRIRALAAETQKENGGKP